MPAADESPGLPLDGAGAAAAMDTPNATDSERMANDDNR